MTQALWLLLGVVAAALYVIFARRRGPGREQAILALGLVIAAVIYVGFAVIWGNSLWIAIEMGGLLIYGLFVLLAWRYAMFWLALGWAAHPLWDILLHWFGRGHTIAPEWYVLACLSFDLLVASYIFVRIRGWRDESPRLRFGRV